MFPWLFFGAYLVTQMVKCLSAMRETWVQSLGLEDPLEEKKATHSSTLAWKSPWMEEPSGLQSMGSQRVGHDWATSLCSLCVRGLPLNGLKNVLNVVLKSISLCNRRRTLSAVWWMTQRWKILRKVGKLINEIIQRFPPQKTQVISWVRKITWRRE